MAESLRGAYSAERAAALAGVPKSTLYYWASHQVLKPSLSGTKPMLWTYGDVVALRIIQWLRRDKDHAAKTSMTEVRHALRGLQAVGASLADDHVALRVDRKGGMFVSADESGMWRPVGHKGDTSIQGTIPAAFNPLVEYRSDDLTIGPDLRQPRAHLKIIPGKLGGEPHVEGTRIGSQMVDGLVHESGLDLATVITLYPMLNATLIDECVDLERQLTSNIAA